MSFKEFEEHKHFRFNEFDEARKYIEDMTIDIGKTLEAIDYMVSRKEYYFLLKNLVEQFFESGGNSQLFDYFFSKLSECPKRSIDLELYIKILDSPNEILKKSFVSYLKSCVDKLYPMLLQMLKDTDSSKRELAVCVLKHLPEEFIKYEIIAAAKTEKEAKVIKEIIEYLSIYADKDSEECLKQLRKNFPQFKNKIDQILEEL